MARRISIIAAILLVSLLVLMAARLMPRLAGAANRLTTIALLGPDEWAWAPFSAEGAFLPPDAARWLLLNTDIPYGPCKAAFVECEVSPVAWAGRALENASSNKRQRAMELMRHFVARGASVNQISQGLAPLHEAVLYRDGRYLDFLLGVGADACARADRAARSASGLTPLEFCLRLELKRAGERRALCERLRAAAGGACRIPAPHA